MNLVDIKHTTCVIMSAAYANSYVSVQLSFSFSALVCRMCCIVIAAANLGHRLKFYFYTFFISNVQYVSAASVAHFSVS